MLSIHVNGLEISCRDSGEGPPIVLFHGFGGQPSDWRAVENQLRDQFTVLVPNLSRIYLMAETFSQQVDQAENVVRALTAKYGKISIAGASFGGALAWALRHRIPEWIERVVLVNPMPPEPLRRMANDPLRNLIRMSKYPWFLSIYLRSPLGKRTVTNLANSVRADWVERFTRFNLMLSRKQKWVSLLLARFSRIMTYEDWSRWEETFNGSGPNVLLVVGEQDGLFGTKHAEWMAEALGNCELVRLEQGAHMAIRTNAEDVLRAIEKFFGGAEQAVS